jgi:hypothetical protein
MDLHHHTEISKSLECDSMVNGKCEQTTLEQCVNICQHSPFCEWGQFTYPNTCMPVRSEYYPKLNPQYLLKPSAQSTVFIKQYDYPVPPIRENIIFLYDTVQLQHVQTGVQFIPDIKLITSGFFSPYPHGLLNYIPLSKETPVMIFDFVKDRILRPTTTSMEWIRSVESVNSGYNAFYIIPPKRSFTSSELFYSEVFQIQSVNGCFLTYEGGVRDESVYLEDLTCMSRSNENTLFRLLKKK